MIEIFSQLPICSAELTCSSSFFGFCISSTGFSFCCPFLCKALFPESLLNFPSTSSLFCFLQFQLFAYLFQAYFYSPTLQLFFAFHFVLAFLFCAFFTVMEFTGCGLIFTTQVNNFFSIQFIVDFTIFCTVHGHVFLFMDYIVHLLTSSVKTGSKVVRCQKLSTFIIWMVWEMTTGSFFYKFDSNGIKLIASIIMLLYSSTPFCLSIICCIWYCIAWFVTENVPKTLSKAPCLVAKRMSLTLHLLLFEQSM